MRAIAVRWRTTLPLVDAILFGAICALLAALLSFGRDTIYNNYTLLAQALLHGHIAIAWPGPSIDALPFEGRHYVIEGPVPALLLLPLAAVSKVNQTLFACTLAGAAMGAAWEYTRRAGIASAWDRMLLLAFLFFGTDLAWCAMLGDVWMLAHIGSVAFTLMALVELQGRARPWIVLLAAVLAAGSRFALVIAIPIYLVWLWGQRGERSARSVVLQCAVVLLPALIAYVAYNEARWHVPLDRGYWLWYRTADPIGDPDGSPFDIAFLAYQLKSMFLYGFRFAGTAPYLIPDATGQALTFTAPALAIAFFARAPRALLVTLWLMVAVTAAPNMLYYVNGTAQFGMRHALDFIPFLFALMVARAVRAPLMFWQRALCVYSSSIGGYGIWYWNTVFRNGF